VIPAADNARAAAACATDRSPFAEAFRATWAALDVLAGNIGPYTHAGAKR
jgi:hypothetical protein